MIRKNVIIAAILALSSFGSIAGMDTTANAATTCTKIKATSGAYKIAADRLDDETNPLKITMTIYTNKCSSGNRYAQKMVFKLSPYNGDRCITTHKVWTTINPDKFADKDFGAFDLKCGKSKSFNLYLARISPSDTTNRCLGAKVTIHGSGGGLRKLSPICAP